MPPIIDVTWAVITSAATSVVTLAAAGGGTLAPAPHAYLSCLKYGSIRIVCSKFGVKEREGIFEGDRAPAKAIFGRAVVTTATLVLYASLTACVLGEEGRP